jgi:hypothetical protein
VAEFTEGQHLHLVPLMQREICFIWRRTLRVLLYFFGGVLRVIYTSASLEYAFSSVMHIPAYSM